MRVSNSAGAVEKFYLHQILSNFFGRLMVEGSYTMVKYRYRVIADQNLCQLLNSSMGAQ